NDGPAQFNVRVRVSDGQDATVSAPAFLSVKNLPPTISIRGGDLSHQNAAYVLDMSWADKGHDTIGSWTIDSGDRPTAQIRDDSRRPTSVHFPQRAGATCPTRTFNGGAHGSGLAPGTVVGPPRLRAAGPRSRVRVFRPGSQGAGLSFSTRGRDGHFRLVVNR